MTLLAIVEPICYTDGSEIEKSIDRIDIIPRLIIECKWYRLFDAKSSKEAWDMPLIAIKLHTLRPQREYCFDTGFSGEEVETRIKELALEYLSQVNETHNGITWSEAMENISVDLWEKHSFCRLSDDFVSQASYSINRLGETFLIPSKEARLMETASRMTMCLLESLDPGIWKQSPPGLQERICDFTLIWAPRFVDYGQSNVSEFTELALAHTPSGFWAIEKCQIQEQSGYVKKQ